MFAFFYDAEDNRLPLVVGNACRILVYRLLKSGETTMSMKLPDYSTFKLINQKTRSKEGKLSESNLRYLMRTPEHSIL